MPVTVEEATRYRAKIGRCNFLGGGRPGIQSATTWASRWMSKPCRDDSDNITRVGKYLNGAPHHRVEHRFLVGKDDGVIRAYPGSDWACCLRSRKSKSG